MQRNIVIVAGFSAAITALLCGLTKDLVASGLFVIASALWYIIGILLGRGSDEGKAAEDGYDAQVLRHRLARMGITCTVDGKEFEGGK